jgi:hypothetical protein
MEEQCLQAYDGQTLIYVGELTADPANPTALPHPFERWMAAATLELPQWESVTDRLFVLRRAVRSR